LKGRGLKKNGHIPPQTRVPHITLSQKKNGAKGRMALRRGRRKERNRERRVERDLLGVFLVCEGTEI